MKRERLSKKALAERFGVEVRTVTNWVGDGMPTRRESGRLVFDWHDCYEWREEQIRLDGRAMREAAGSIDLKTRIAEARLRTELAEAERAELDTAERRGELVPFGFMRDEFMKVANAIRSQLLSIPPAWASRPGPWDTPAARQATLTDAVNEMMPLLQDLVLDEPDAAPDAEEELATADTGEAEPEAA